MAAKTYQSRVHAVYQAAFRDMHALITEVSKTDSQVDRLVHEGFKRLIELHSIAIMLHNNGERDVSIAMLSSILDKHVQDQCNSIAEMMQTEYELVSRETYCWEKRKEGVSCHCTKDKGHEGNHVCPNCGKEWENGS